MWCSGSCAAPPAAERSAPLLLSSRLPCQRMFGCIAIVVWLPLQPGWSSAVHLGSPACSFSRFFRLFEETPALFLPNPANCSQPRTISSLYNWYSSGRPRQQQCSAHRRVVMGRLRRRAPSLRGGGPNSPRRNPPLSLVVVLLRYRAVAFRRVPPNGTRRLSAMLSPIPTTPPRRKRRFPLNFRFKNKLNKYNRRELNLAMRRAEKNVNKMLFAGLYSWPSVKLVRLLFHELSLTDPICDCARFRRKRGLPVPRSKQRGSIKRSLPPLSDPMEEATIDPSSAY